MCGTRRVCSERGERGRVVAQEKQIVVIITHGMVVTGATNQNQMSFFTRHARKRQPILRRRKPARVPLPSPESSSGCPCLPALPQCACAFASSESNMRLATNVSRENLMALGTCVGKFTKSGKFHLTIHCLDYLAQHAKVSAPAQRAGVRPADVHETWLKRRSP